MDSLASLKQLYSELERNPDTKNLLEQVTDDPVAATTVAREFFLKAENKEPGSKCHLTVKHWYDRAIRYIKKKLFNLSPPTTENFSLNFQHVRSQFDEVASTKKFQKGSTEFKQLEVLRVVLNAQYTHVNKGHVKVEELINQLPLFDSINPIVTIVAPEAPLQSIAVAEVKEVPASNMALPVEATPSPAVDATPISNAVITSEKVLIKEESPPIQLPEEKKPKPIKPARLAPIKSETELFIEQNKQALIFCLGVSSVDRLGAIVGEQNRASELRTALRAKLEELATNVPGNHSEGKMAKLLTVGSSWVYWKASPFKTEGTTEHKQYHAIRTTLDELLVQRDSFDCKVTLDALVNAEFLLQQYTSSQKPMKPTVVNVQTPQETGAVQDEELENDKITPDQVQNVAKKFAPTLQRLGVDSSEIVQDTTHSGEELATQLIHVISDRHEQIHRYERNHINKLFEEYKAGTVQRGLLDFLANNLANHAALKVHTDDRRSADEKLQLFEDFCLFYEEMSLLDSASKETKTTAVLQAKKASLLMQLRHLAWQTDAASDTLFTRLAGEPHDGQKPFSYNRLHSITLNELKELFEAVKALQPVSIATSNSEWEREYALCQEFENALNLDLLAKRKKEGFTLEKKAIEHVLDNSYGTEAHFLIQTPAEKQTKRVLLLICLRELLLQAPKESHAANFDSVVKELRKDTHSLKDQFSAERLAQVSDTELRLLAASCLEAVAKQQSTQPWTKYAKFKRHIEGLLEI